jgi:hypothetical protein
VQDPRVPSYYNVQCSSRAEWERYVKHRGFVVRNKVTGQLLTAEELEQAKQFVLNRYG